MHVKVRPCADFADSHTHTHHEQRSSESMSFRVKTEQIYTAHFRWTVCRCWV